MGRAIQDFALFGQNKAAGVAVEQGNFQILFQRTDLAADGGLREVQLMSGMGEASRIGHGVKNAELVPVHHVYSAASLWAALAACKYFSASSAAMQPMPAAVTACR